MWETGQCAVHKNGTDKPILVGDSRGDKWVRRKQQVIEKERGKVHNLGKHTKGHLGMQGNQCAVPFITKQQFVMVTGHVNGNIEPK